VTSATDLSPLSSGGSASSQLPRLYSPEAGRRSRAPRPPRGFRLLKGAISNVRFEGIAPHNIGRTFAQRAGLRYEQKVHDVLSSIYGAAYRHNSPILFTDATGPRRAIPDGLLIVESRLVIIEIKLSHCALAWWQLRRLYGPLCAALAVPGTVIQLVEVCRSYDPQVDFPEPHDIIASLHKAPTGRVGVLQWKL